MYSLQLRALLTFGLRHQGRDTRPPLKLFRPSHQVARIVGVLGRITNHTDTAVDIMYLVLYYLLLTAAFIVTIS